MLIAIEAIPSQKKNCKDEMRRAKGSVELNVVIVTGGPRINTFRLLNLDESN
jgi:hypothetical protein